MRARFLLKRGVTASGYALLVGLISVVALVAITQAGDSVGGMMVAIGKRLDADALAADVCNQNGQKDCYVAPNGDAVAGLPVTGDVTGPDGAASFAIPQGYHDGGSQAVATDSQLQSGNIKQGTSIFGVAGALDTSTFSFTRCINETPDVVMNLNTSWTTSRPGCLRTGYQFRANVQPSFIQPAFNNAGTKLTLRIQFPAPMVNGTIVSLGQTNAQAICQDLMGSNAVATGWHTSGSGTGARFTGTGWAFDSGGTQPNVTCEATF